MKKHYHLIGLVLFMLLLLVVIVILRLETQKAKASELLEAKESYDNYTLQMNDIVSEYNQEATLSVERVHLINDYLDLCDELKLIISELEDMSSEYNGLLENAGMDTREFKEEITGQEELISQNIEGFKADLERLNDSVLISYTKKQRNEYEKLVNRINNY